MPNDGIPELRRALADKLKTKNGIADILPRDVFLTNGAMHALYVTFGALLDAGDEVIIPDPMWTEVAENIRLAGGMPVRVPVEASTDYTLRSRGSSRARSRRRRKRSSSTRRTIPPAPCCRARRSSRSSPSRASNDLWIVSDEAYEDVLYAPYSHHSVAAVAGDWADRVISVFSFSKSHAMSGLRVGYVVTRSAMLQERIQKLLRCTINGVNSLAQWAALAAVTGPQEHLERDARRVHACGATCCSLRSTAFPGIRAFTPRGAFYVWAEVDASLYQRLGVSGADELSSKLAANGIGSAPGDAFGEHCVRRHSLRVQLRYRDGAHRL